MRQLIADRDYPEAEEMARQLLQKLEAEPGPESLGMATALDLLGEALYRGGEEAEAEPIIRRAISVKEKLLGKNHQEVAISLKHLGNLTSDLDAALGHYRKSLEIFHASVEPNPLEMGRVQLGIGSILRIQGKLEQAELVLAQALATLPNGEWTKDRVKVRLEKGRVLMAQGRYQEAESQGSETLILLEKVGLEETLQFAKGLRLIVQARWRGGRAREDETLEFARRAVRMSEEMLGPESVEYADALIELGNLLQKRGEYADAEDLFGPEHLAVAGTLLNLANITEQFNPRESLPLYERTLEIYKKALGPEHPSVALTLQNLGLAHFNLGDYETAERLQKKSLQMREKTLGTDHPLIASNLGNLAILYSTLGDPQAAAYYERAITLAETALGPEHESVAILLGNRAVTLKGSGDLPAARQDLERARGIFESAVGPDHVKVAWVLDALAELLIEFGDYATARSHLEKSRAICEGLPAVHFVFPSILSSLGSLYSKTGEYALAQGSYERALSVTESLYSPDHPSVAGRLEELAEFHTARGDLELARKLFERSLEIWEGRTDPPIRMAGSLKGLASVAATDGDLNRAVNLYRRALRIQEEGSSPDHPQVAELLSGLAAALLRLGEGTEALQASLRAETIARKHFQLTARGLSETEALAYASSRTSGLNLALSMLRNRPEGPVVEAVWNSVIRSRALIFDEMAVRHQVLRQTDDPAIRQLHGSFLPLGLNWRTWWCAPRGTSPQGTESCWRRCGKERRGWSANWPARAAPFAGNR